MSALPRQPDSTEYGYQGLCLSAEEFLSLAPTREHYELVHGVVCMSPRPNTLHQRLLSLVQFELELYVRAHPGAQYFPDVDLEISPTTVYAPDIVCYAPGRVSGYPARMTTPPDLVFEILSPGTKAFDLTTKRDDYERFGVGEFWALDPLDRDGLRARVYRREGNALMDVAPAGDVITSKTLAGFSLSLANLRKVMPPR